MRDPESPPREDPSARGAVRLRRAVDIASTVGLLGLAGWLVALAADPRAALRAWLTAWTYGLGIALGALSLALSVDLAGGSRLAGARRVAAAIAMSLTGLALGLVPLLLGGRLLAPSAVPAAMEILPGAGSAWADPTFMAARWLLYTALWSALAVLQWRGAPRPGPGRLRAAVGVVVLGVTAYVAAFDWLTSMAPERSTAVVVLHGLAGSVIGALSALVILTLWLSARGHLARASAATTVEVLGRLLLAAVLVWTAVAYAQGTSAPFVPAHWRLAPPGTWSLTAVAAVAVHFAVPLSLLMLSARRGSNVVLAWAAAWLLVVHWLDVHAVADGGRNGFLPGWEHLPATAAVLGLGFAFGAAALKDAPSATSAERRRPAIGWEAR